MEKLVLIIDEHATLTGSDLRQIRNSLGLSAEAFARRAGYSLSQIQRMETGTARVSDRITKLMEAWGHVKRRDGMESTDEDLAEKTDLRINEPQESHSD